MRAAYITYIQGSIIRITLVGGDRDVTLTTDKGWDAASVIIRKWLVEGINYKD